VLACVAQVLIRLFSVRGGVVLGRGVHIGPFSVLWAARRLEIGDNCYIGKFCTLQVSGRIGRGVLIANNVGIVGRLDHEWRVPGVPVRDGRWIGTDAELAALPENQVEIADDVWIGFGSVILSGVSIGEGAIIAAGSVVTRDIGPYEVVAGSPASVLAMRFGGDAAAIAEHRRMLDARYPARLRDAKAN